RHRGVSLRPLLYETLSWTCLAEKPRRTVARVTVRRFPFPIAVALMRSQRMMADRADRDEEMDQAKSSGCALNVNPDDGRPVHLPRPVEAPFYERKRVCMKIQVREWYPWNGPCEVAMSWSAIPCPPRLSQRSRYVIRRSSRGNALAGAGRYRIF